jgi:Flp pilus assembly protein TadB
MRPAGQSSHCRRADEKRHTALSVRPRSRPPTTYTKCAGSEDSGEAAVGGPVLVLLAAGVLVLVLVLEVLVLLLVLLLVLVLGVGWARRTWRKSWLRDGKEAPHCRHASAAEEEEEEEEEGSVLVMAMSVRDRGREGGRVGE